MGQRRRLLFNKDGTPKMVQNCFGPGRMQAFETVYDNPGQDAEMAKLKQAEFDREVAIRVATALAVEMALKKSEE
jgi:hypothetical protein